MNVAHEGPAVFRLIQWIRHRAHNPEFEYGRAEEVQIGNLLPERSALDSIV